MQIKIMKSILIVILLVISITSGFEISSKIDFNSDEKCADSLSDNSDTVIVVIKNSPDVDKETSDFRTSGSRSFVGGNFPGFPKQPTTQNNHNRSPSRSKLKSIYIVVNGKNIVSSIPASVNCNDEVCETTVITSTDDEGNAIGSVSVKAIAKTKSFKVDDVPIIEGIRASGYENDRTKPTYFRGNGQVPPYPIFIDNRIPQGHVPRRNLPGVSSASFNPRNFVPRRESTVWNPWISGGAPIDDKIEPPLSKT